jgi:meiotically up-regulated gene 157 (Mug157) protein
VQLNVWETEQWHEEREVVAPGYNRLYRRPAVKPSRPREPWTGFVGLPRDGKGSVTAHTGMVWSAFRPSDDPQQYGFLVPGNMFAVVGLNYVADLATNLWERPELATRAKRQVL